MMKKLISAIQFISIVLVFILLFITPTAILPVSKSLLERINPKEMELFFPLLLTFSIYISYSYWLLIKNTNQSKLSVYIKLVAATFLLFPLMGFIESSFWLDSLKVVDNNEYVKIFFRYFITFTLFSTYLSLLYKQNNTTDQNGKNLLNLKLLTQRLLLIGGIYILLYNIFGYFVAWQFEATRIYYTGTSELKDFFTMLWINFSDPKFVIVHFIRGILFGLSGYIFYTMLNCSKLKKSIILALIFGGFGFQIILPNPIFPEMVRISHFIETTTSMIVFGMISIYVFDYKKYKTSNSVFSK
ncbi:hypothetical protein ACFQ0I_16570 [Mariniflexile aquimaris]|uniref:Uncharacterized protein n=1 Tax=Mariniflexile aquimaris TaxID=881009 RepID=A0ABW3BXW7_9FLAO